MVFHWATSPCRTHWVPQNSCYQKMQQHPLPTTQTLPGKENNQIDGPRAVHCSCVAASQILGSAPYSHCRSLRHSCKCRWHNPGQSSPLECCSFIKLFFYQQEALNLKQASKTIQNVIVSFKWFPFETKISLFRLDQCTLHFWLF